MTVTSSSNNRSEGVCDAVVWKDHRAAGPLRLPENRADDFIDHFNRTYQAVGMKLAPVQPAVETDLSKSDSSLPARAETEKIPDS